MNLSEQLSHGSKVSRRWVWRFWEADEIRLAESRQTLDLVEQTAQQENREDLVRAAAFTRDAMVTLAPDTRSQVSLIQSSLEAMQAGAAGGVLAEFAVHLASDEPALNRFLFQRSAADQPGWEADFLKHLSQRGLGYREGLVHLADRGAWSLPKAAALVERQPEESVDLLKQLEPSPLLDAYDQLNRPEWQRPLAEHLIQGLRSKPDQEPLEWLKPFFLKQPRKELARWVVDQVESTPWGQFAKAAEPATVEVAQAYYQGQALEPRTALAAVASHLEEAPELLERVLQLAHTQNQTGWVRALQLLKVQSEELRQKGIDHLLGSGLAGLERSLVRAAAPGPALAAVADSLLSLAPDDRLKSFLVSLGEVPFTTPKSASEVRARGALILTEESPTDEATELALLACRSCDATSNISDKFSLLQQALSQLDSQLPDGWGREAVRTAWDLSHLPAEANQLWLRTAVAHQSLRLLSRGIPATEADYLKFGRQLFLSQSLVPEWHEPVHARVLAGLDQSDNCLLSQKLASCPSTSLAEMVKNFEQLSRVVDFEGFLLGDEADSVDLERGQGFLAVGDFEVPVQDEEMTSEFTPPTRERPPAVPTKEPLVPDWSYTEEEASQRVVVRQEIGYKRGQGLVFHPVTGQFVHESGYKRGVAGGYLPWTGEVRFEYGYKRGVGAVYQEAAGDFRIEQAYKKGVAGLKNPVTGEATFRQRDKGGEAGAVNPYTGKERWQGSPNRGQSGYYDLKAEEFRFATAYKRGVALATNDPGAPTLTSNHGFSYDFDDD